MLLSTHPQARPGAGDVGADHAIAAGPVIGPPIGGFIVTYMSWRWIFFLNIPIAIMGVILVTKYINDIKEEDAGKLDWWV
ncbi:MAG: MFS transporter [Caulobacteraceae bacterium]